MITKTDRIPLRVSPEEKEKIKKLANKSKQSVSEYCRRKALGL